MSNDKKGSSYISARESRRITRFNRRITRRLEKERAEAESIAQAKEKVQQHIPMLLQPIQHPF